MADTALIDLPTPIWDSPFMYTFEYGVNETGGLELASDIEHAYSFDSNMEFIGAGVAMKKLVDSTIKGMPHTYYFNPAMVKLLRIIEQEHRYRAELALWVLRLHSRMGYGLRLFNPGAHLVLSNDSSIGAKIVFSNRPVFKCEE